MILVPTGVHGTVPGTVCESERTSGRPEVKSYGFPREIEEFEVRIGGGE